MNDHSLEFIASGFSPAGVARAMAETASRQIRKVAVLGAGTMGSRIAAHVTNAGIPVVLLDMVPPGTPIDGDSSIRNKLASLTSSTCGKAVRLAACTGLGLIPGYGTLLGMAAGAIDYFLVDRVLPRSGILAFLEDSYPSLFVSS